MTIQQINEIYENYKKLICETSRLTDASKKKIRTRNKTFTIEQLNEAMKIFSKDKWWMEHNSHRGVSWFFYSDDRIDQFLNLQNKKSLNKKTLKV